MAKILKHYKGGLYTMLAGNAVASSDIREGEEVMVYVSLQDGKLYARSFASAAGRVRSPDGLKVGPPRFAFMAKDELEREVEKRMKKLGLHKAYVEKQKEMARKAAMNHVRDALVGRDDVSPSAHQKIGSFAPRTFHMNEQHTTHVTKSQARKERAAARKGKR